MRPPPARQTLQRHKASALIRLRRDTHAIAPAGQLAEPKLNRGAQGDRVAKATLPLGAKGAALRRHAEAGNGLIDAALARCRASDCRREAIAALLVHDRDVL